MATSPGAPLPQELRNEPRWSHFEAQQHALAWTRATDDKLVVLVTRSTASGERFPVGVNWLDVSRAVGHSPVECVKRYALLHQQSSEPLRDGITAAAAPVTINAVHNHNDAPSASTPDDVQSAPFSGLSCSDDDGDEGGIGSPRRPSFSGFSTPLASPKLSSLDTSDEFGVAGLHSPGSPPPFAVRTAQRLNTDAAITSSPSRWDALLSESAYASPVLQSPPLTRRSSRSHQAQHAGAGFGVDDESKSSSPLPSASGAMSPRIIHGTQDHTRTVGDPHYASSILHHAFKGSVQIDTPPVSATSPRMIRTTSATGDFPFLKDDDTKRAAALAQHDVSAPAFLASPRAREAPLLVNEQQLQAHLLKMSAMSTMSSFHGDHPFAGSLTQSALEDAFLDMAGSRLDASKFAMGQSRVDPRVAVERPSPSSRDDATPAPMP